MPQSLAKVYLHLVFSTRNRERILADEERPDLHAYMGGILKGMNCMPIEINSEPDHVHVLFMLGRTLGMSAVVGAVKKSATDWLRARSPRYHGFHWQSGYGVFSVSQSAVETVRRYIRNQRQHHRGKSFMDEYRAMLEKHEIEYDERYVWE
jgi:REP element-mobilizing transposase RayT